MEQPEQIRLLFVGDTSFGENYQDELEREGDSHLLKTRGYDYSLQQLKPLLDNADFTIANLETPITKLSVSPHTGKKKFIHWDNPTEAPAALQRHRIHAVSLANNHVLDFGVPGLEETFAALRQHDLLSFGAGKNTREAARPLVREFQVDGQTFRLSVLGGFWVTRKYDEVLEFYADKDTPGTNGWTRKTAAAQIRALRKDDPDTFLVCFPHWGGNYDWKSQRQTRMAHAMIDAGADLVIGHGAHMLQEIERYKDRWIVYGIGNFVFNSPGRYQYKKNALPFSLAARLDIEKREGQLGMTGRLYPILSDNLQTDYQPRLAAQEEFEQVRKEVLKHSDDTDELEELLLNGQDSIGSYFRLDLGRVKTLGQ